MSDAEYLENVTYDELTTGRKASLARTLTQEDVELLSILSGNLFDLLA